MDGGRIVAEGSPARADRALLHPRGARAAVRARASGRAPSRSWSGLAERVEVLPDRLLLYTDDGERVARRGAPARAAPVSRAGPPRRRWRTCSSGSPAGAWSTDEPPADAPCRASARRAARRRALLDVVPAQLAGDGRLVGPAAGAVPRWRSGVGSARSSTGGRRRSRHRRRRRTSCSSRPPCSPSPPMQIGAGESTYPVLSGFKWQRIYLAMTATPLTPAQVLARPPAWVAIRLRVTASVFLRRSIALFGGVTGPGVLVARSAPRCSPAWRSPRRSWRIAATVERRRRASP